MERFLLGHVAAQVHEKAAYIRGVQLVTVQACPSPGREHCQKCCVFYKLLFLYYFVAYRIRTALKTTKELEPRSLQARVRRFSNLPSYRIPRSFSNSVCSSLRRARSKLPHVPSYPALSYIAIKFQQLPMYRLGELCSKIRPLCYTPMILSTHLSCSGFGI